MFKIHFATLYRFRIGLSRDDILTYHSATFAIVFLKIKAGLELCLRKIVTRKISIQCLNSYLNIFICLILIFLKLIFQMLRQ